MHLHIKRNVLALHLSFYFTPLALALVTMVTQPGKTIATEINSSHIIFHVDPSFKSLSPEEISSWIKSINQEKQSNLKHIQIAEPLPDTLLPPDMASPAFIWEDPAQCTTWLLCFDCKGKPLIRALLSKPWWVPEAGIWKKVRIMAGNNDIQVKIIGIGGWSGRETISIGHTYFRFSLDNVGAWLMFMQKPLPFLRAKKNPQATNLLAGDLSSYQPPKTVMKNLPVCANCHTYSSNGRVFAMDMDYGGDKGAFVLSPMKNEMVIKKKDIFSWNELPPLEPASYSMGLFAKLSPSGRYLAATVNETSVFVMMEDLFFSQLFFPSTGQIAIFDRKSKQYKLLPGASQPDMVQTSPEWSPDGKTLAFAAVPVNPDLVAKVLAKKILKESPRQKIDILNKKYKVHFNIFTVPFCKGKGGKAKPLPGASNNGYSNYFPRYSPNGRWMVFTQSPTGLVLQPESRLYIAPAKGGNARPLKCNMPVMNSWHSWSPNSKWLVFTCKANSPYTELYLTHIDDQGKSSPAVRLFRFSSNKLAAMVPEFISLSAPLPEYLNLDSPEQAKGASMAVDGR